MNIINKFRPHIWVILIILLIALYLVLRWLPGKTIIAGGDIGIPNLLPQKQLNDVLSSWWDSHGTGVSSPTGYTSIPYYIILTILDLAGFTPDITQKIVFFTIIAGGALSIYFLALMFSFRRWFAAVASLFYIFNLTSLAVWQRGIHNAMFMLLLAPLSLLILVWGVKQRKYTSIFLINIVSFLLSYVFGALGYVFSLWLLWSLYIFVVLIDNWKDKNLRQFLISYYFLLLISWLGTNSWWILHLLTSSNYVLGQFTSEELRARGSDVLNSLKPYHEPSIILRGVSRFYHYVVKDWGEIYLSPYLILLSWIPTLLIFSTILVKSNYKSTFWRFLIVLTVSILIFSKGVNPPLGDLNKIPFDHFHFLAPLRNTYEKVGILLVIPFSLLFALGISQFISFLKAKRLVYLNVLVLIGVVACLTILVWPIWVGSLFKSEEKKYAVPIPSYYAEANEWLKSQIIIDDSRILHLPMAWGESIDYNWEYTGIEPSQYFFNGSSIGYHLGVASVDSRFRDLVINIHNQDSVNIQKAFASLNIGWVVVHNETLHKDRILESPERINAWVNSNPYFLEHVHDVGPMSIWRVKDEYRAGHLYALGKVMNISRPTTLSSLEIWQNIQNLNDGFVTEVQGQHKELMDRYINRHVIFPKGKIKYYPIGSINAEAALKEIAIVNHLPDSVFYPLINLKENVLSFLNQYDQVRNCFSLSGKRLKEAALFARQNKVDRTRESLKIYETQLDKCAQINKDTLSIYLNTGFLREEILGQLIRQRAVLENEFSNPLVAEEGIQAKRVLNQYLADLGLGSKYDPLRKDPNKQIIIFSFSIPKTAKYNIQIDKVDKNLLNNALKIIQIDDLESNLSPVEVTSGRVTFGTYEFSEGFHEIHLEANLGENLLKESLEVKKLNPDLGFKHEIDPITNESIFVGEAIKGPVSLKFDLPNLDITEKYEVSFDTYFDQGAPPIFTISNDTDPSDKMGDVKPAVKKELEFLSYPIQWRHIDISYPPSINAISARLAFTLIPWNDCVAVFSVSECQETLGGLYRFDRPTNAKIKNLKVEKVFEYDLTLERVNAEETQKMGRVDIDWKKITPTLYEVNLTNQKKPYVIVFSETFHPLWTITDLSGKKIDLPHFSINGFANGWFVESDLPEKIKVKFALQDTQLKNTIIAMLSFVVSAGLLFYLDRRQKNK